MIGANKTRSLNKSRWLLRSNATETYSDAVLGELNGQQLIDQIAQSNDISPLLSQFLVTRILRSRESPTTVSEWQEIAHKWLNPNLDHLYDPYLIDNMEVAVERISAAIAAQEKIRIVTDYDVDGTTSSLILQSAIRLMGHPAQQIDYHIPDRFDEGYGFSIRAAETAIADGVKLIITADIGVRDHLAVETASKGGADVIICDHHLPPGESVPKHAVSVLCPPQASCKYPNPDLAACGVSLKLAQALLENHPRFSKQREMIIKSLLKVAAIGTIADVVSLASTENRTIVSMGIRELRNPTHRHKPGLQALLDVSGVTDNWVTGYHIGYQIAPRINAAGRMHLASEVVELFHATSIDRARELAGKLDSLNKQRQEVQQQMVEEAIAQVPLPTPNFIVVAGKEKDGWHRGVVGIVAGRLRDRFNRPAVVISQTPEGARGSVRSIPQIHAVRALDHCAQLLEQYGGHPAAAGFSCEISNIPQIEERLSEYVQQNTTEDDLVRELYCDAIMKIQDIGFSTALEIERLGPFGKDNPRPVIWLQACRPTGISVLKDKHLRFNLNRIKVIWFNSAEHLDHITGKEVEFAVRIEINRWKGRSTLQLNVQDARVP